MGVGYLDFSGTYRGSRGRVGADPIMGQDTGPNGRYPITTGEAAMPFGHVGNYANWRRVLDPKSPAFAVLALGFLLLVIHARFDAGFRGSVSK